MRENIFFYPLFVQTEYSGNFNARISEYQDWLGLLVYVGYVLFFRGYTVVYVTFMLETNSNNNNNGMQNLFSSFLWRTFEMYKCPRGAAMQDLLQQWN